MFRTRLLSGIVLVIVAIALILLGGWVLLVGLCLISLIGMYELCRVFKCERTVPAIFGYIAAVVYYLSLMLGFLPEPMMLVAGFLILLMFAFVFGYPRYHTHQVMAIFFSFFYVAVMLSYVFRLREMDRGMYLAFLIFLCSWGCDTCAYCVGMLWGKFFGNHKMSPRLSPKKSIEGAIGGVVGAALLTVIFCVIFKKPMELGVEEIAILAGIAAVAALISMVGDLTASAIKRNFDVKDYGNLIPGHGGILDRFDSMIITAPILFYLAQAFLG